MEEEIKEISPEEEIKEISPEEEIKEESTANSEIAFSELKKYVDIKINEVLEKIKSPEIEEKKEEIREVEVW